MDILKWFRRQKTNAAQDAERRYYEAGKWDRLTKTWFPEKQAGDTNDIAEVQRIRDRAHWLYGNNPYINKAIRTIVTRLYGYGLTPESAAVYPDGTVHEDFRERANQVWSRWVQQCHSLGAAYQGGDGFDELICLSLKELLLSGEFLIRTERLSIGEMEAQGLEVPLKLTLIEAERLVETFISRPVDGESIFRGIIFNPDGTRKAYRIYRQNPWHIFLSFGAEGWKYDDFPASEFLHVFQKTRPSSIRGISFLTPILLNAKNLDSLVYNEIVASAINSCFAATRTKDPLNMVQGLNPAQSGDGTTDRDGNTLSHIQPGQIIPLAPGEKFDTIDPKRPNNQLDEFCSFLTRNFASGLPCLKSSSITGDYRSSSFSSEKSAENDAYWEIAAMQNWFQNVCLKPIYAQFIEAAIMAGAFDGIELPPVDQLTVKARNQLYESTWHGPTTKSLNPVMDETAVSLAVGNGTSNLVDECAKKGEDWRENLKKVAQVYEFAKELNLPDFYVQQLLGAKAPFAEVATATQKE